MLDVEVAENMYHPCLGCGKYRCPHNRYLHSNVSAALIFYTALRNAVSARLAELAQELPAPALRLARAPPCEPRSRRSGATPASNRGCAALPGCGHRAEMRAHGGPGARVALPQRRLGVSRRGVALHVPAAPAQVPARPQTR